MEKAVLQDNTTILTIGILQKHNDNIPELNQTRRLAWTKVQQVYIWLTVEIGTKLIETR